MSLYKVQNHCTTVREVWIEANNQDEALEICQMDHVSWGKDEVVSSDYEAIPIRSDAAEGEYVYDKTGCTTSKGNKITLPESKLK